MLNDLVATLVRKARAGGIHLEELITEVRKQFITDALETHRGNQSKACADLKMHRNTLARQIDELDINVRGIRHVLSVKKPASSVTLPEYVEHTRIKKK